ncbi:MAG: bifunctional adenosylcobinamide kinase/adenosylcobinamide-phosphate guanylyltransferase [Sporichthyaceae bacterium]
MTTVPPPAPWRALLLGGARSGKSAAAEARAAATGAPVLYLATAAEHPDDPEWVERIAAHRERRPAHWQTVATADPAPHLRAQTGVVLLDCLALWLTRAMDDADAWNEEAWNSGRARTALAERVTDLLDAWRAAPGHVIAVSNEVGMGVVPATSSGRRFRDELGRLNLAVAAASDEVALVVAGRLLPLADPAVSP